MQNWLSHWWGRDLVAGMIASLAMALYMMVAMAATGLGFWSFLNVTAGVLPVFGPPMPTFDPLPTLMGLAIHLGVGACLALMYGVIAWAMAPVMVRHYRPALITGALYATLIYIWLGRLIGPALEPAIAVLPKGHYLVGYLIFGTVTTLLITRGVRGRSRQAAVTFAPATPVEASSERR
jgi:hypothetical protein